VHGLPISSVARERITRRLAKYSREDKYQSRRDYQEIRKHPVSEVAFRRSTNPPSLTLGASFGESEGDFLGFAAYVKPSQECQVLLALKSSDQTLREKEFALSRDWNRLGAATRYLGIRQVKVELNFSRHVDKLLLWGLDCGIIELPAAFRSKNLTVEDLESPYICPESLYLPQSTPLNMEIDENKTSEFDFVKEAQELIELKKCSYCGRYLPLDSSRPGSLAFHKHNAKRTGHQNECRSCKKLRINDTFNPRRTVDQLHESSLITRERKLFLREPEILQRIKDRHGDGLKSIVWKRFGRRCFLCQRPLKLSEVELDHTRPIAYLWPIDEFATCLCATCNNLKKDRFPVDVYTDGQLRDLARITGLPYEALTQRSVNEVELKRIIDDIARFASTWDPRTFNATRRKIRELKRDIDLLEILKETNPEMHKHLTARLEERPEGVA
jgi:hypothetical protein